MITDLIWKLRFYSHLFLSTFVLYFKIIEMEMVLFYFNEGPYAIYSDKVRTIGNAHSKLIYYQD